MPPEKSPQSP
ncbi:hypothetical protein CFC21_008479, partial [Triticum aestivum]